MYPGVKLALNKLDSASDRDAAKARYQQRLEQIESQVVTLEAKDRLLGRIRVGLVLAAIVFWIVSIGENGVPGAGWIGSLLFALFYVAAGINEPVRDSMKQLRRNASVIGRLIARLDRDWNRLATHRLTEQLADVSLTEHRRDTARDLDLLGRSSLFHLTSMTATMPGARTLASWLAGPAVQADAIPRGEAIECLAPLRDQRIRFYTLARQVGESTGDPDHFVQWASGDRWLAKRNWLRIWARASAWLSGVCIGLILLGVLAMSSAMIAKIGFVGVLAVIVINIVITTVFLGPAHQIFSIAMANRRFVDDYVELFSAADWLPKSDGMIGRLRRTLVEDRDESAVAGMRRLGQVARAGSLRQSAGTFLLYLPLQALMLWDVRVLDRLEQWQSMFGDQTKRWFESLGELESLMSLAALKDDYPSWATPTWIDDPDQAVVQAQSIGHPLLGDADRVINDVTIGPPGTLLLITGSNMSGKSTMLRSVGLNVALAGCGAPVCAQQFALASTELATSIRVSDDVAQGVSFYMAELNRLKSVVDHARQMAAMNDRVCLFLLDEILQGTNSRERQIAVVRVLDHLIQSKAIGAITTHDLELADEPAMQSAATTVHFRETIRPDAKGNEQMTFDYKMQTGVSPTTNALRLLEMVGLGESTEN